MHTGEQRQPKNTHGLSLGDSQRPSLKRSFAFVLSTAVFLFLGFARPSDSDAGSSVSFIIPAAVFLLFLHLTLPVGDLHMYMSLEHQAFMSSMTLALHSRLSSRLPPPRPSTNSYKDVGVGFCFSRHLAANVSQIPAGPHLTLNAFRPSLWSSHSGPVDEFQTSCDSSCSNKIKCAQ